MGIFGACRSALTFGSARASAPIFPQLLPEMLRILTLLTLATATGAECVEECVASGSSASRSQSLLQVAKTQRLGRAQQFLVGLWGGAHVLND